MCRFRQSSVTMPSSSDARCVTFNVIMNAKRHSVAIRVIHTLGNKGLSAQAVPRCRIFGRKATGQDTSLFCLRLRQPAIAEQHFARA